MRMIRIDRLAAFGAAVLTLLLAASVANSADAPPSLADDLRPLLSCLSGGRDSFSLSAKVHIDIEGKPQDVDVRLVRYGAQAFDLEIDHADYSAHLRRRDTTTALALPHHKVVFLGRGEVDEADRLAPEGLTARLISPNSLAAAYAPLVLQNDPAAAALLLTGVLQAAYDPRAKRWTAGSHAAFQFDREGNSIEVTYDNSRLQLEVGDAVSAALAADDWPGFKTVEIERRELERQLARGVRRGFEIAAPAPALATPQQQARKVEHGELRWIGGQRVVLLSGTPDQVGKAHGQLLSTEAWRCIDSVLHTFGTVQTIRTGRWFRHDLEAAYARLSPHIPEDHKREARALGEAIGIDSRLAETMNVFPEQFHCSGFAVFGSATKDGKLYHGRVLDYMTTIGLQDAAATFVVAIDGKIPFANVGYAGFVGSVSGMNARSISLGEMGGRGEGKWDGVPMATLMRRALEECETLDQVMDLWRTSPRTCEYYYVFADGKANRAVGVAATPDSIVFVQPGQGHELLGEGIADAVVLSAGQRLQTLRQRVQERHGQIDDEVARWLMSRPVAMQSNLHNVLFVPADGVLYVANADHRHPAAERPYVRLDLNELLKTFNPAITAAQPAAVP